MPRLILAAVSAMALAACATQPTLYQPATGPRAIGYAEYQIERGRYRITFRGGPGAPADQVSDYALLRAADLAIANGYDWFQVADRYMEGQPDNSPRVGFGFGGADYGHHSSVGVGVGVGSFSLGGGATVSSTIEVVMGRGARPYGLDVYDARSLRRNVGGPF
jgi:hypothetical protein